MSLIDFLCEECRCFFKKRLSFSNSAIFLFSSWISLAESEGMEIVCGFVYWHSSLYFLPWYYVKKKYKLNVNSPITLLPFALHVFPMLLIVCCILSHIHLVKDIRSVCVSALYYKMSQYIQRPGHKPLCNLVS